jgi:hypothetical protein
MAVGRLHTITTIGVCAHDTWLNCARCAVIPIVMVGRWPGGHDGTAMGIIAARVVSRGAAGISRR